VLLQAQKKQSGSKTKFLDIVHNLYDWANTVAILPRSRTRTGTSENCPVSPVRAPLLLLQVTFDGIYTDATRYHRELELYHQYGGKDTNRP
jgi:hypothetical protein